jgi:hypothetical protein
MANSTALADGLQKRGYTLVSGAYRVCNKCWHGICMGWVGLSASVGVWRDG